jgi:hypothetical protein
MRLMALELYYTSSPRGLRPGTSGLCTVAMTRSMSVALASRLESLCGYRPPGEGVAIERWPAALSHWTIDVGGVERHVLAAVRPVKPDHTMRSNTLAHFAVLHNSELDPAGAAWMLSQPETSAVSWSGEPRLLDAERAMPRGGPSGARACRTWTSVAGDAGWAGVLANAAMLDPTKPATVIYPMGTRVLDLVGEAMSLLPAAYRWRVTFTTYFTQPIAGVRCTWRFCLDGTSAATAARQAAGLVIDVCTPQACTRTGEFVEAARAGRDPVLVTPAAQSRPTARIAAAPGQPVGEGAFALEPESDADGEPRRRVPARRPVGMDEESPAGSGAGRTALVAAVVTSVVLLAIIAVLVVLLRSTSLEVAALEARAAKAQEERDVWQQAGSTAEQMQGEVSALNQSLSALQQERDTLMRERDELKARVGALEVQVKQYTPADATTQAPNVPAQPAPPASAPPPSPASPPSDAAPSNGATRSSGGGEATVSEPAVPAATSMRRDTVIRGTDGVPPERVDKSASSGDSVIAPRAPLVAELAKDDTILLPWPTAMDCGVTAVSLTTSAALESLGFSVRSERTLAFGKGSTSTDVVRIALVAGGVEWTWIINGVLRARPDLAKAGLSLPEDWGAVLGQMQLHATCGDGTKRTAVIGTPQSRIWKVGKPDSTQIQFDIPRALAAALAIEWGGTVVPCVGVEAMLAESELGGIEARTSRVSDSRVTVKLKWMASEAEQGCIESIQQLNSEIAAVGALASLLDTASKLSDHTQASQVTPKAREDFTRSFTAWQELKLAQSEASERKRFEALSSEARYVQYRAALREQLAGKRSELNGLKTGCDNANGSWRESLKGAVVLVRPDRDSPPLFRIEIMPDRSVPSLSQAGAGESSRPAAGTGPSP